MFYNQVSDNDSVRMKKGEKDIDKPESQSQSKVQAPNPKRQIQKGKEEFGLWAVYKIL